MRKGRCVGLAVTAALVAATLWMPSAVQADRKYSRQASTISAEEAVTRVKAALPKLSVGPCYIKTDDGWKKKLRVALVLDGRMIVSKLNLNPDTGEIMPKGQKVYAFTVSASKEQAVNIAKKALPRLEVGYVHFDDDDDEIEVDLMLDGVWVAKMTVHGSTGRILTDRDTAKDAARYRR